MGDRGNIYMAMDGGGGIFFYSHWGGSSLPQKLQKALERGRARWDDEPYLARIIFCEMVSKDDWADLTGYGITTYLTDNEHPILVVNADKMFVGVADEAGKDPPKLLRSLPFDEYIKLSAKDLKTFINGQMDEDEEEDA